MVNRTKYVVISLSMITFVTLAHAQSQYPTAAGGGQNSAPLEIQGCITNSGYAAPISTGVPCGANMSIIGKTLSEGWATLTPTEAEGFQSIAVNPYGAQIIDPSGIIPTYNYSAVISLGITGAIGTICGGNTTSVVKVSNFVIEGVGVAPGTTNISVEYNAGTAPTGGTFTVIPGVESDRNDTGPTEVVRAYTVAPTPGTVIGTAFQLSLPFSATLPLAPFSYPSIGGYKNYVLRNTTQCLLLINGTAITGDNLIVNFQTTDQ